MLLSILVALGCGNDDNPGAPPNVSSQYFPNRIGTQWVYAVYDSVRDVADTITVKIVDTVTIAAIDRVASIWTFEPSGRWEDQWLGNSYDTLWIVGPESFNPGSDIDTVSIYFWPDPPTMYRMYVLPLAVDGCWRCVPCNDFADSTCVKDVKTLTTPSGKYIDAFGLEELYSCGDECAGRFDSWFKPGVGIVRAVRVEHDIMDYPEGPQLIASWELITFHPAP